MKHLSGIVGCTPTNVPLSEIPIVQAHITWVFMGYNPQESLQKINKNTMGTLLGVHPTIP